MVEQQMMIDLFDRWERVWRDGEYALVPDCVAPEYLRHDENGDRTVTPESYAAELAHNLRERPGLRVVVYDHLFAGNRAWFRFAFEWTDPASGEKRRRAGMQSYRTEGGRLAETWIAMQPVGSAWSDAAAQESWTSPPPMA
jgi:hypothetical protein